MRNVQHLGLILGAASAGALLPAYFPTLAQDGTFAAGVTGAVANTAINLFSNFMQKCFDRREQDPTLPDVNGDFLRLVGDAIAGHIARFANSSSTEISKRERTTLTSFAGKASAGFVALVQSEEAPAIPPQVVLQLLADVATDESTATLGEIDNWRKLVARLAHQCQVELNINTMIALASWLHAHLWHSLETELKKDFAGEGKAYAVLHLSFMGAVLSHLQTLTTQPKEQERLTRALSEQIGRLLAQDHGLAFRDVFQPYFDGQFGELKVTLARLEAKLDARDDVVVKQLLDRISEEAQEKGRLRAELEAALHRLAEAEAKGNVAAGETLTQLRKDGDPKPLGAFLDQQLAEKQTDLIELLRERLAVAYVSGEIDRAKECAQQILATLPNDLEATNWLGIIYNLRGDLAAAEKQYQRLLGLAPNDESWRAKGLGNLGLIYWTQGKLAEAEQYHRDALEINQKLGRLEGQANQLGNLGLIYQTQGKLAEAEQYLRQSLEINQKLGRLEGQARQLGNLGGIYQTQGKLAEAEQYLRQSLEIDQKLGRLEGQARQLGNLGLIAEERGNIVEARRLWTEARDLFARVGMAPEVTQVEQLLARL